MVSIVDNTYSKNTYMSVNVLHVILEEKVGRNGINRDMNFQSRVNIIYVRAKGKQIFNRKPTY